MTTNNYQFDERLAMSQGFSVSQSIGHILTENIPGATMVRAATKEDDKTGVDWWVEHQRGEPLAVDVKIREKDCQKFRDRKTGEIIDDLALEYWSVQEKRIIGWTANPAKRCDYILWLWQDTGRWCLMPFAMLVRVFLSHGKEWCEQYPRNRQRTDDRYSSACVFVPRAVVWRAIYEAFA